MDDADRLQKHVIRTLVKLSRWQQVGLVVLLLVGAVLGVLFLIFNERIFAWIEPFADRWRGIKSGWLILWFMTFVTAFPPVVGYSTCLTISGFLYGLPNGLVQCIAAGNCDQMLIDIDQMVYFYLRHHFGILLFVSALSKPARDLRQSSGRDGHPLCRAGPHAQA